MPTWVDPTALTDRTAATWPPTDRDVVDLRTYLPPLIRWWFLPVVLAAAAAAVAWFVAGSRPASYAATATIRVSSAGAERVEALQLLRNRTVATQVIIELGLDKPPHSLAADRLESMLAIEETPGSPLAHVTVEMSDPDVAASVANVITSKAVAFQEELAEERIAPAALAAQRDAAKERFDAASARYVAFQRTAQVDVTRRDVSIMLDGRARLAELQVDLNGERARLAKTETELAEQPSVLENGQRTIADGPLRAALAADPSPPEALGVPQGIDVTSSPLLNPVHQALAYQIATTRARIALMEGQRDDLIGRLKPDRGQQQRVDELVQKEADLTAARIEYEIARDVFQSLARRYEETRANLALQAPALQIVDPARRPSAPLPSGAIPAATVAGIAGLLFGFAAIVALTAIETVRRRPVH